MREIKFRGKLINSGKWSEGNLIIRKGNNAEILACTSPDATPIGTYGRIDVDTIGQYTGLKDKNGKEIYEGDIIEITRPCVYETGKIIFKNGCFFVKVKETLLALWECKPNNYELKVIGNIYDNPELLEV